MANIKKIKVGATTYDIYDATAARSSHTHSFDTITNVPLAGFEDILKGIKGRTQVEWNALNAGEYGSNSTYNGATLPPVILENNSGFWNSASGKPLDISFHFAKKEKITTLQVKCPPYSGVNPTMTVYYAQKGDTGLTLYKEIATISTADRKAYEFNEEGISADYWVVRFTSSGWIDLRLCSPSGLFTTGLYTEECHQQIMDRFNGYQPVGNYALKNETIAKSLTSAKGDMIYASAANTPDRLKIGTAGQFLSVANGVPKWVNNPNTDTKNTAGSTNDTSKLYLVGAKSQATNPQTYSNSSVYMTGGTLYANALNTGDIVGNQVRLKLQNPSGDGTSMDAAYFDSSDYDEPILGLYGHLAVYGDSDSSTNPNKPANQTAITDLDTDYFNTGIALKEADDVVYKLSFPGKSGTFALTSDIKSLTSNTTASGGIKYITEVSFTNGVLTLESKYLHLK